MASEARFNNKMVIHANIVNYEKYIYGRRSQPVFPTVCHKLGIPIEEYAYDNGKDDIGNFQKKNRFFDTYAKFFLFWLHLVEFFIAHFLSYFSIFFSILIGQNRNLKGPKPYYLTCSKSRRWKVRGWF